MTVRDQGLNALNVSEARLGWDWLQERAVLAAPGARFNVTTPAECMSDPSKHPVEELTSCIWPSLAMVRKNKLLF